MRVIKFLIKLSLSFLFALFLLWLAIVLVIQTKQGKQWIIQKSQAFIEKKSNILIEFDNVEFIFPLGIRIDHLKIFKHKEVWLTVDEINAHCLTPRLFQGKFVCSDFVIKGVRVYAEKNATLSSEQPFTFSFPYYLKFEKIAIEDVQFMPDFVDQFQLEEKVSSQIKELIFNLHGMLGRNPWKSTFNTHLLLVAKSSLDKFSPIKVAIDSQNNLLSLSLHADRILLPESELKTTVALSASATFEAWMNLINQNETKINGKFKAFIHDHDKLVRGNYLFISKNDIRLFDLNYRDAQANLTGKARLNTNEIIKSTFQGELKAFDNLFFISGNLHGPYSKFLLHGEINQSQLKFKDQLLENFHTLVQATIEPNQVSGSFDLYVDSKEIPYAISSDIHWNKEAHLIDFDNIKMTGLDSQLAGEIKFNTNNLLLNGFIATQKAALKPLAHFAKLEASGLLDLKLNFISILENGVQRQGVNATLDIQGLIADKLAIEHLQLSSSINPQTIELETALQISNLKWKDKVLHKASLHLTCQDVWTAAQGELTFNLNEIGDANQTLIQEVKGLSEFSIADEQWPFLATASGALNEQWNIDMTGNWHVTTHTFDFNLEKLIGLVGQQDIELQRPFDIHYATDQITSTPFDLRWGENYLLFSFAYKDEKGVVDFKTTPLSSDLLKFFSIKLPFSGRATFNGHLEGKIDQPLGKILINFEKLQFNENYLIKKNQLKGRINLLFDENVAKISSQIYGLGHTPLLINGQVPYKKGFFSLTTQELTQTPLNLEIRGEGDLDDYLPIFMDDYPNVSGPIKMDLQLGGNIQTPSIKGFIKLENGIYENQDSGATYDHVNASLEGNGTQLVLKNFSAHDNHGGTIQGNGTLNLDQKNLFPFDFQLEAARVYLIHSDYASISASGPLVLSGNIAKSKLRGELKVDRAVVKLEEALPKQIKTIDVNFINVPEGHKLPFNDKASKSTIELDVKLNAQEVVINGNGLKSDWKGQINISGTTKQPLLFGDLHITKGLYEIKGKTFNLSQGSIHFAGSAEKKTTLYVVASKEIDSLKVEIIVKGPLNKLTFSFRSNPPLSQREILSYILFNKGISDVTTGEGDTINQTFVSLNADQTDEKQDLLTRLRNNIGIDRLDFTSSGEGENRDFALQVGKYLWDGVFISLNKSIGAAPDRIAIEAKLLKNVKAEAEVDIGSNSQGKISLKWKKDY